MNEKPLDQLTAEQKRVLLARLLQEKTAQSKSYPLSFAQQRLWLLDQLEPNNPAYNIFTAYRLVGELQTAALESGLNQIIQRHASLRTAFTTQDDQPVQVVHPHLTISLINHDLRHLPEDIQAIEIEKFTQAELLRPFDLKQPPLLRATLLQLSELEHIFILIIHHIVADGWSLGILFKELEKLYPTAAADLPKLSIQYTDFTRWQRQYLQNEVLNQPINYWKQQLAGAPPTLALPTDFPRPPTQTFQGARQFFTFSKTLLDNLKKLSQQGGVTLFMTLLAGFFLLLHRHTGQEDIVLGSPIAGRNRAETEDLIGFFVNTVVLRLQLQQSDDFLQLLAKVRQVALDAYHYQDLPFEILIEQLHPERNLNFSPLFQVMFAFQNVPSQDLTLAGITAIPLTIQQVAAKFDLMLFLEETEAGLHGIVEYNTDLFAAATLQRLVEHLRQLLEAVIANPQQKISQIPIVTSVEQQLFTQWNATQRAYPASGVSQLIEQQAEITPDAIAICYGTQTLTYRELNQQANQLAHYLRQQGVQPDTLVGIYSERHLMMIIGLLGILKAGGAYLPLDSGYPAQRLAFMIADSQIRILLTQNSLLSQLPQAVATVICLDTDWQHIAQQSQENLIYSTQLENLAYVIYTSGSTGKPKGVQVLQRGLVNFLLSMQRTFGFSSHDKFLAITTISFDIAGLELFLPLICGAQVMLVNREVATDAAQLIQLLPKVTVMQATPATWRMLLAAGWQGKTALTVLCGGEALTTELSEQLLARSSVVWNMYGPTETTVWSSCYRVIPAAETARGKTTEFIGHPIDNTQFYILDQQLQPVPIGVIGELHITGDGVAQGYLHRNELTAEKFIANPFQTPHDGMYTEKLYKTGDLARYRDDGVVECLGRTDNQIKLRGFRIELGEIEAVVAQHPDVQEVAVTVQTISGDKRLVAYLVLQRPVPHLAETLREFLREKLPEYMLPAIFVDLDGLPHTPSGKIDRHRLPAPTQNRQFSTRLFVAPRDEIEAQLVVIFEKLLNTRPISVADNFFDLGGHSLLGVTLLYQVQQTFHKDIPLMALFRHPTIAQLAELIKAQGYTREWCALEPIRTEGQGKAFFFIGSTNYARVLAPLLRNTHPIYGLNIFGLQDHIAFKHNLSIESIAQHYVKEIEGLQPDGPYYLCAYCADTAIVYEMARALMARGKLVGLVAFLDSIWEPNDLYFGLYRHWRNLQNFGLGYIGHKMGSRLYFIQLSWSLRLNRWMKKLYKTLGKTASRERQDMSFISQFYEALEHYTPTALPGLKVTLFLSCEWRWKYSPALEKLTGEPVKIHEIPVYHDNMFVEPWILELAMEIDHCLQAADAYYHVTPTTEYPLP